MKEDTTQIELDSARSVAAGVCERLVGGLIGDQESALIRAHNNDTITVLMIRVAENDQGKVLGQKRRILDSLKRIMARIGRRYGLTIYVELEEPTQARPRPFRAYSPEQMMNTVKLVSAQLFSKPVRVTSESLPVAELFAIELHPDEDVENPDELKQDLEAIIYGIGRTFGRIVHVGIK